MNTIYKVVWNAACGKYVVASELAKGRKKASRKALVSALAIAFAASAPFGAAFAADSPSSTTCTTADGRSGTLNAAGVCTVQSTTLMGGSFGSEMGILQTNGGAFNSNAGQGIAITHELTQTMHAYGTADIAIGGLAIAGTSGQNNAATTVGDSSSATAASASAFGTAAHSDGAGATAMGANTNATGAASIAIGGSSTTGSGAQALALHSIAIGEASIANAAASVAVGEGAISYGSGSVVMGSGARDSTAGGGAFNANAVVIGNGANVTGAGDGTGGGMALGNGASAFGGGIALGSGATASGTGLIALGVNANTAVSGGIAIGSGAKVITGATVAMAIGAGASVGEDAVGSIALGSNATVGDGVTETVALGHSSTTNRSNAVAVGSTSLQRQIVNVAAGTQANDAVIVSQLQPALTALGATLDPATGAVTTPSYTTANGGTSATLQGALTGLDSALTTTNTSVSNNATAITDIRNKLDDGTLGLVQQSGVGANVTVGANTDGVAVDFTGTAGTRTLTGVKNGEVSAASQDAINGSQLHGVSESVAGALGGNATVSADGSITAPTYTLADGSTVTGIGNMFTHIDGRVSTNEGAISGLADQLNSGSVGLVQQAFAGANLTVGAGTGGAAVDFTGTNGMRILTGVANGVGDDDVVTMSQLKAAGLYDPSGDPMTVISYDDHSLASVTLGGSNGTLLNNVAAGQIASGSMQAVNGGQLFDMRQSFQSQYDFLSNQYGNLNDRVGTIEQGIADGTIGGGGGGVDPALPGSGEGSTQIGDGAIASGEGSTAIGKDAVATGSNSTATGTGSQATGSNSTANGAGAMASASGSTAVGAGAVASGTDSTALGSNASATGNNSVALGAGSVADRDNTVSVGSEGNERQITNVAAGTQRTDATNWGQVQDAVNGVRDWADQKFHQMDKRINRMGAMSAAYGQMAFSANGLDTKHRLGVGIGNQNGQSALAVGYSRQIKPNLNLSFGGSAAVGDVSLGAGMSYGW